MHGFHSSEEASSVEQSRWGLWSVSVGVLINTSVSEGRGSVNVF
jgi:hypothetical protein